jgi:hypothetical protein
MYAENSPPPEEGIRMFIKEQTNAFIRAGAFSFQLSAFSFQLSAISGQLLAPIAASRPNIESHV